MSIHKQLTLSEAQYDHSAELMKGLRIESFSEFFRYLVLAYEQGQKNPVGRPRGGKIKEADHEDDDGVAKYKCPDKNVTSPYTLAEVKAWYEFDPRRGQMPPVEELELHSSFNG